MMALILGLSALFSYLLVVPGYFPYLGLTSFFIIITSLVLIAKDHMTRENWITYLSIIILSLFYMYRTNGFLLFLNTVLILYLGSTLVLGKDSLNNFIRLLTSPFKVLSRSLITKSHYKSQIKSAAREKFTLKQKSLATLVKSVGLTLVLLLIIVPLLSYSNPIFESFVTNFLDFFDLYEIVKNLFSNPVYIVRLIVFAILAFFSPKFFTYSELPNKYAKEASSSSFGINLTVPKTVVALVLGVFFITQAQLYFSSDSTLEALGYSNSRYAQEVFFHLSIVAGVIFSVVYSDKLRLITSKVLTYILIIEALFLNLVALKSVSDYISFWGFTHKRLYGVVVVLWLFGIFGLFTYKYFKNLKASDFLRNFVYLTSSLLILVNIVNFDYIIYHHAKSTTHSGIDHYYLSRLSVDSRSYKEHLEVLMEEIRESDDPNYKYQNTYYKQVNAASNLVFRIKSLKKKYAYIDLRGLNVSEFLEYKSVKNTNIENISREIASIKNTSSRQSSTTTVVNADTESESKLMHELRIEWAKIKAPSWSNPYSIQFIGKYTMLVEFKLVDVTHFAILKYNNGKFEVAEVVEPVNGLKLGEWEELLDLYEDKTYPVGLYIW